MLYVVCSVPCRAAVRGQYQSIHHRGRCCKSVLSGPTVNFTVRRPTHPARPALGTLLHFILTCTHINNSAGFRDNGSQVNCVCGRYRALSSLFTQTNYCTLYIMVSLQGSLNGQLIKYEFYYLKY